MGLGQYPCVNLTEYLIGKTLSGGFVVTLVTYRNEVLENGILNLRQVKFHQMTVALPYLNHVAR